VQTLAGPGLMRRHVGLGLPAGLAIFGHHPPKLPLAGRDLQLPLGSAPVAVRVLAAEVRRRANRGPRRHPRLGPPTGFRGARARGVAAQEGCGNVG
jgi:hypothetical protein